MLKTHPNTKNTKSGRRFRAGESCMARSKTIHILSPTGLGALIMSIGILVFLGIFFPKVGLIGDTLAIIMTLGTLSFLVTTPEVWVPNLGSGEFGFPLLSGAGRLVIKDIVILASAVVLLSDSSQRVLKIN